jgi:hypothetical protein
MNPLTEDDICDLWLDAEKAVGVRNTQWSANIHGKDWLECLPEDVLPKPHGLDLSRCRTIEGDNEHCHGCLRNLPMAFDASKVVTWADLWRLIDKWRGNRYCDHKFIEEIYLNEHDSRRLMVGFGS